MITVEHVINKLKEFPLDREVVVQVSFPEHFEMEVLASCGKLQYGIGLTSGEGDDGRPLAVFLVEVLSREEESD